MPRSYAPPHMRTAARSRVYHSSAVRPAFPSEVRFSRRGRDDVCGYCPSKCHSQFRRSAATNEAKLDISIPHQARIDRTSVPRSQRSRVSVALATRSVQSGARCDGIAGIYGNPGIVESVTYRIERRFEGFESHSLRHPLTLLDGTLPEPGDFTIELLNLSSRSLRHWPVAGATIHRPCVPKGNTSRCWRSTRRSWD
jgi:hypothetical protein